LFAIDEIISDLATIKYTVPLSVDFLSHNQNLIIDTRHFSQSFVDNLIAIFSKGDDNIDGVCIHSDNFHTLKLIKCRYENLIKCIYIDPPYNTDATPILYKNGYKVSSWISLMDDRIRASRPLLQNDGILVAAIDDVQSRELSYLLSSSFDDNILGTICVRSNPSGRPTQTGYAVSHEYLFFAGQSHESSISRLPPTDEQISRFNQKDENGSFEWRNLRREGSNSDRTARKALYYPIYICNNKIRVPEMTWSSNLEYWIVDDEPKIDEHVVYPDNEDGEQKTWRWEGKKVMQSLTDLAIRKDRTGRDYIYYKRRPNEEGVVSVSSWFEAKYSATEQGTLLLKSLFGKSPFPYPKSLYAVIDSIYIAGASTKDSIILDFFGGSGTTGHAVISLNRTDGGHRKYILTEI